MKNIAVFVSGSGSNAENLFRYFEHSSAARVTFLVSSRREAYALTRAANLGLDAAVFFREQLRDPEFALQELKRRGIDYIVLAGFLALVPETIIRAYAGRILNIHPALLPKFGGKGMYGEHVHRAVIEAGERQSGITIHRVNEAYDSGRILFQAAVDVDPDDTPQSLASKIHALEYLHFPKIVEAEILKLE
ncbi:MAG: phosphoribosylglycinamide formyltransferase [Rikenellaceae bacterium]|nr:phosphoribosylglycinamide formyltransferase [Rikenellaceae bacterium]